nr:endolytic transglycosylase MltG [Propionibacterium sp.]
MRSHKYDTDPLRDPETGRIDPVEFKRRLKGWLAVALAFAVLLGGGGFLAVKGYQWYADYVTARDFTGPGQAEVAVVIPPASSSLTIGKLLVEAGVVKNAEKFRETASSRPDLWQKVQAGKYNLQTQIPALTALQQLTDPSRAIRVWLLLREGQRLDPTQINEIAKVTKLDAAAIRTYLSVTTPAAMGIPAWAPQTVAPTAAEGFLFPDTYEVPDGVKPETMVKKAIAQFNAITKKLDFEAQAETLNFGTTQPNLSKAYKALIVASIIDREVFLPEDRGKVAQVIYNRLAQGMKLDMDSTVAYAVGKTDGVFTTEAQRKTASPYNTYLNAGLPPGPISAPGEAALSAAINPEPGDWLYFVSVNLDTGETVFSADLTAHKAAVAQLQAWCAASEANRKKCG